MARLAARHGGEWPAWAAEKIEAVAGDLGKDRFGLAPAEYAALCRRVDRVVARLEPAEISWMMARTRPTVLVAVPRLLELLHAGIFRSVDAGGPALRALFKVLFALSRATGGRTGRCPRRRPRCGRDLGARCQRHGGLLRRP